MDLWTRNSDKRYYWVGLERDLFGLVVVIAHGGRHRPPRVRAIPVWDAEDGERLIARIGARRRQHGYTLVEQDAGWQASNQASNRGRCKANAVGRFWLEDSASPCFY